jgi:LPXTG-motif cell wall-anchored protein
MQQTNPVNETLLGLLLAVLGLIVAGYVVLKRKKAKEKSV